MITPKRKKKSLFEKVESENMVVFQTYPQRMTLMQILQLAQYCVFNV